MSMDAGNREEEDRYFGATLAAHNFDTQSLQSGPGTGTGTGLPPNRYHHLQHHLQPPLQLQLQPHPHLPDEPVYHYSAAGHLRPLPSSQFASHAASNHQAAHANATTNFEPVGLVDPDDFYRAYDEDDGDDTLMASTLPASRQNRDASLRSNGNGSTPRHPTIPLTRTGPRPALRSVSAPVDEQTSAAAARSRPTATTALPGRPGHQPSVKDLKKRFDQNAAQSSSNAAPVRKTTPRNPVRETPSPAEARPASASTTTNGRTTSYTTLRSSVTRDSSSGARTSSGTRSTQRNRTVAEDQLSNNAQSFASRIAKPRATVGAHGQASETMTNLSPTSSPDSIPPVPQPRSLLFGEIGPGQVDAGLVGHGIDGHRTRRTSESNLQSQAGHRQRSFSHTDADPPSPSDWYRETNGETLSRTIAGSTSHTNKSHSRSRSDLAGTKSVQPRSKTSQASRPRPTLNTSMLSTSSKLPVSVRKLSTPSNSSSPTSTRSNSPSTRRRPPAQGKLSKSIPVPRAKTPTSSSNTALKRPSRSGAITPNDNTRLNAYIAAPPPKLSPPLRSSRPRQTVSTATTTSSRLRAVERGRSPANVDNKASAKANEPTTRRRKISMGPIDFESRREQIKLSYTKSIRDGEARASARKVAEEKRKKAVVEAAKAQIAAAEALTRQEEKLQAELTDDSLQSPADLEISPVESLALRTITTGFLMDSPADAEAPTAERLPLPTITTGLLRSYQPDMSTEEIRPRDSPTLGIPGSFPDLETPGDHEEPPRSAISDTTEFDAEPQTEPPVQEAPLRQDYIGAASVDVDDHHEQTHPKFEYRSPFEDESLQDDGISIKISLDPSPDQESQVIEPAQSTSESNVDQENPSSAREDEYEPRPLTSQTYQTKVTIIGRDSEFPPSTREASGIPLSTGVSQAQVSEDNAHPRPRSQSHRLSYGNSVSSYDTQPDRSAGLSEIEEFFVGPIIRDSALFPQGITARLEESRDGHTGSSQHHTEEIRFSADSRRTMGTRPSLTVPRTSESMNRASQTTAWTEYSANSQDRYSGYEPKDHNFDQRELTFHEQARSESDSRPQSYQFERNSRDESCSRDVSPFGTYRHTEAQYDHQPRLPEIDTSQGFVVNYVNRKNSTTLTSVPILPDHSPPPPPDDVSLRDALSSAPPSEYFDETRPNSYFRAGKEDQGLYSLNPSRRESEDLAQTVSATQSIDQGSLETSEGNQSSSSRLTSQQTLAESISIDPTPEAQGLSTKERKRLFTRLEIIKEMIDTEAFFIRDMNIVEEIYKGTAEACPKLDDTTVKLIFRNTDQIVKFHSAFLVELKEGVSSVYTPKVHRSNLTKGISSLVDGSASSTTSIGRLSDDKDRQTSLGPIFVRNMEKMKIVHEAFLKNSDHAAKRLIQIQEDPTVQVWLNECNEVARDLTKAWNLDSLLIKPMQRITKYPNLLIQLLHETPTDHPDRPNLESAKASLENAIEDINKTKKNFELVGQIVGSRKRKESDVKAGFARAFGKRVDKLQAANNRPTEDPDYLKLHEKFGDDYLRLQVVLRDVEFYTRQVAEHVHEFLQYLSSMELVMRLQPSPHPEIESKWVRFNVSMRDVEKVALEQHLSQVRKQVIEPFELVIKSYGNPSLAMKKRAKRRLDYERSIQLKKAGKKVDKQLSDCVEQYEALNEALKKELPKLSALTEKVGNICLGNLVNIQAQWFGIWKEKLKVVLEDAHMPEIPEIVSAFQRDYKFQDEQMNSIGIVNGAFKGRPSQSTSIDESFGRLRPTPADLSPRNRGLSLNSDTAPTLPTPDFMNRRSGQFAMSPSAISAQSPHQYYYRDFYGGINGQALQNSGTPKTPDLSTSSRSLATPSVRPGTGQSYDSGGIPGQSAESVQHSRRYSNSAHPSPYQAPDNQRYSGLFQSALPVSEGQQERHPRPSIASSRASSRERQPVNGYNVLWLAASLFEFNIETIKHEAGYPYLTYSAGEIFDVIAEKGELWLAKNQDDPNNLVGWLWSKHFAKLADD
ncbi:Uu.00g045050.m01.CDS01 [Anthostomella pinea]|uniref:Uu.00g045050.m01.CDS01 n=1 Tax=Anthostomella pinea TaxID=933095 RepID=A0AAI8VBL1_9PEZI|nr:Uu.00g045050.m01.CDS01 [Anthostomella pinea]